MFARTNSIILLVGPFLTNFLEHIQVLLNKVDFEVQELRQFSLMRYLPVLYPVHVGTHVFCRFITAIKLGSILR